MRSHLLARVMAIGSLASVMVTVGCAGEEGSTGGSGGDGAGGSGAGNEGGSGGEGGEACKPATEICDGKDNDCDKQIDEVSGGCACQDGQVQDCYSGRPPTTASVGECVAGTQTCEGGQWGACEGEITPDAEACNGLDDDCNGAVDDLGTTSCGVGACMVTVEQCVDGQPQTCTPGMPSLETCDGVDNNCNQLVDESDPAAGLACDSGLLGVCQAGTNQCVNMTLTCVPSQMPGSEACDDLDNDCNGTPDDNVPGTGGACNTGQPGVCSAGTVSCQGGTIDCFPDTPPSTEVCDLVDNDCNGLTDETDPSVGMGCDTGQPGVCQPGTVDCNGGMLECVPNVLGSAEVCNLVDDNCDGQVDEGNPGGGVACGCGGAGTTACVNGGVVCQGGPTVFFQDDFSDNAAGWTLGTEWQIGPAVAGPAGNCADPGTDTSPTADNGVAGVIIGNCSTSSVSKTLHGYYYLTSPVFNASTPGSVVLQFRRVLHSDYTPYMNNVIEVWNGSAWVQIWQSGGTGIHDATWQTITHDLTAYKNAAMQVRWGFNIASTGVFNEGSWSLDDVYLGSAACP